MSFEELLGNRVLVDRLRRMAAVGRIPPSLLFTGPEGVGKLQAATALAQVLNCAASNEGTACGRCTSCRRIERGEHPDVRIIRPEGAGRQLRAEAVRQIVSDAPFRPFEGQTRVFILAEAERLNPTAANTLLKTLEEPPPWVVLILVTANENALLPTIRSRCQVFRFAPIPAEELVQALVERHAMAPERATMLAALSGGSLSKAVAFEEEPLSDLRQHALRLAEVVVRQPREQELVSWADELSKDERLLLLLHVVLGVLRDVTSRIAGGSLVHRDLEADIKRLAGEAPLIAWVSAYGATEEALRDLRDRYLNKRITMGRLLMTLRGIDRDDAR